MTPPPHPASLQAAVRLTRAALARAEDNGDTAAVDRAVRELRDHAKRAAREAREGGFPDQAGPLIRALADETDETWAK